MAVAHLMQRALFAHHAKNSQEGMRNALFQFFLSFSSAKESLGASPASDHKKPKVNQTKMEFKQEIKIKTNTNARKTWNKKQKQKWMNLIVFRKTKSIQDLIFQAWGGSRRMNSSLSREKGSTKGLRRWPFTLKVRLLLALSSSTTPFECTWWIVKGPNHLDFNLPGKIWSLES